MEQGVIFFGHGARDIRWKEPFDQIITLWKTNYPNIPAELAFLEMMTPNLLNTVTLLANQQISSITIIPVFFGQGGHLRNDFPILIKECQEKFPDIKLSVSHAVGQELSILQAITQFARNQIT